ncbi:MAG TPA: hypothetical protein VLJ10_01290 [Candidatus Bathyarchaeia archaeon]|nr:hypothetical protein [Candidatus Bathyarchaeia archaeon]
MMKRDLTSFYEKLDTHLPELLIGCGIVLRLKYWFENRALWLDEAYLGIHTMVQTWKEILLNRQMALDMPVPPMGFMLMEKIFGALSGYQEMALRLFPLICGITAMFLFFILARKILSWRAMLLALALMVFNNFCIDYAVELKQYSTDLMFFLGLSLLFVFRTDEDYAIRLKDAPFFAIAGVVAVTFSHPSVFILAAFGLVQQTTLLFKGKIDEAKIGIACGFCWAVMFFAWQTISYQRMSHDAELLASVLTPGYMMNVPLWSWEGLAWYGNKIVNIISRVAGLTPFWMAVLLLAVGAAGLHRRNPKAFWILFLPLLFALIAAGFKKYLLGDRFSLFMIPSILITVAYGLDWLCERLGKKGAILFALISVVFLAGALPQTWGYFVHGRPKEESREHVQYLQSNFQTADVLIVNESGYFALFFYLARDGAFQMAKFFSITDGVDPASAGLPKRILMAVAQPEYDRRGFFHGFKDYGAAQEVTLETTLDFEHAQRIWFFGSHMKGSEDFILEFFQRKGQVPAVFLQSPGSVLMRFDLKENGARSTAWKG